MTRFRLLIALCAGVLGASVSVDAQSDTTYARLHPREAARFDSLAALPVGSASATRALERYNAALRARECVLERRLAGLRGVEAAPCGRPPRRLSAAVYLGALAAGASANARWRVDDDAGGYRDRWQTLDKQLHAAGGAVLAGAAMTAGVRSRVAALGACGAGVAWEASQRYRSGRDAVATCGGAAAAWAWRRAWGRP
jgi:hypothetical protein